MPKNRSRWGLITACIFTVAIAGIIILSVIDRQPSYTVTQVQVINSNFATATAYDNSSFIYSDGQSLMIYHPTTGKSSQLSPQAGLSGSPVDSISVSGDKQFVLFHDEIVAAHGILYQQLQNQGLDPTQNYWWLYNVSNKTFQPLPQTVILAKIADSTLDAISGAGTTETLTEYSLQNLQIERSLSIPGSTDFQAGNSTWLLETPGNKILSTTNGVVNQTVADNTTMVALSNDGQQLVLVTGQGVSRQLVSLNLANNKREVISGNIVGQPAWSIGQTVLYTRGGSQNGTTPSLYSYDLVTHKSRLWKFNDLTAKQLASSSLSPVALAGATAIISSNNSYYLLQTGQ